MSEKSVTIKDVAEYCGISKSLVGYILNGSTVRQGSEEVRARVYEAARLLGYRPNRAAKMLVGKNSQIIGVSIDSCSPPIRFRQLTSIERAAKKHGYRLMINENSDGPDGLLEGYRTFSEYGVAGVIYVNHDFPAYNRTLGDTLRSLPRVMFLGKPVISDTVYVDIDWSSGIQDAVTALIRSGRTRPALVVDRLPFFSIESRIAGFRSALLAAGLQENEEALLIRIDYSNDPLVGQRIIREAVETLLLPARVDAVLVQNDLYAAFLLQELFRRGIRVPEEIAVVGYDNDPFGAGLIPPLASIDENVELEAQSAMMLMLELIESHDPVPRPRFIRVPTTFVPRESAGIPASNSNVNQTRKE